MADRPIIFSGPMVRALLDGRKTQTRRVLKLYPSADGKRFTVHPPEELIELEAGEFRAGICHYASTGALSGPYKIGYAVGDRLWVRERCLTISGPRYRGVRYLADQADDGELDRAAEGGQWDVKSRPSIHMPRWASRLTLTVTDVRVQRLQEIGEADAEAEGALRSLDVDSCRFTHLGGFKTIWRTIHGEHAWVDNPWVVAPTFTVERRNIDHA